MHSNKSPAVSRRISARRRAVTTRPGQRPEPESQNAKWIFDNFGNIGFFMDLHSYGQDILYSWGDDEDQSANPAMNFLNPAYDGQRGVSGDAYKEYIPAGDLSASLALAADFRDAVQAVRGTGYTVKSSFNLYPTAGTSDDYAYSRHFADPAKSKIISYTLEWGTEFQPPYAEMQNIIAEITCGLVAFCLHVRKSVTSCTVVTDRSTFGKDEVDALLHQAGPAVVPAAFYVVIDGFGASELGISAATLSGAPEHRHDQRPPVPAAAEPALPPAVRGAVGQRSRCCRRKTG